MNEFIEIRFRRKGKAFPLKRQLEGGIEFDEPDAIERTVGITFDAASPATRETLSLIWGTVALPGRAAEAEAWYRQLLAGLGATTE